MHLIKLHGSTNWRVLNGSPKPFGADAIRHHEDWFRHFGYTKVPLDDLELLLEPKPFMVPPEQAVNGIAVLEAIEASARTGAVITIKQ